MDLFAAGVELPAEKRAAFLDRVCGDDDELRRELGSLLDVQKQGLGDFLETPAVGQPVDIAPVLEELERDPDRVRPPTIEGYSKLTLVGQGGMGVVFEAEQDYPKRRVALKVLNSGFATSEQIVRFKREANLLGRLQHPGIAQVFNAGTFAVGQGSQPFIAMEFVEGSDLLTYAARQGLSVRERIKLLSQVCDAAHHAHSQGVLHRDLKPDNVLVDGRGQPKILDFGISRSILTEGVDDGEMAATLTQDRQLLGTLGFMAPEQLEGAVSTPSPALDVYALGAIGFELLTGRKPVPLAGVSLTSAIKLISTARIPAPSKVNRELGGDADTMLLKALEREPAQRYRSADALGADLLRHLDGLPIHARPATRAYRLAKFVSRERGVVATLAVLSVALVVTALFAVRAQDRETDARMAEAREQQVNRELTRTLYGAQTRLASTAAMDPSGLPILNDHVERWRALAGPKGADSAEADSLDVLGWEFELLEAMTTETTVRIPLENQVRSLAVDGAQRLIAVGVADRIEIRSAPHLELQQTLREPHGGLSDIALSDSGHRVIGLKLDGSVVASSVETGEVLWEYHPEWHGACAVAWCEEPECALAATFSGKLVALDPASGEVLWKEPELTVDYPQGLALMGAGPRCAVANGADLRVGEVTLEGFQVRERIQSGGSISAVGWKRNGREVVVGTTEGGVEVWDLEREARVFERGVHSGIVQDVTFSPDGQFIATASQDHSSAVLAASGGRILRRLRTRRMEIQRALWNGSDQLLVAGEMHHLKVWDVTAPQVVAWSGIDAVDGIGFETQLQVRRDRPGFDLVYGTKHIQLNVEDGLPLALEESSQVRAVARTRSGDRVAWMQPGRLHIESVIAGDASGPWSIDGQHFSEIEWNDGPRPFLAVATESSIYVLEAGSDAQPRQVDDCVGSYPAIAWSSDGRDLFVTSSLHSIARVDPTTRELMARAELGCQANDLSVSPDGEWLCAGTQDDVVLLLDPASLAVRETFSGHTDEVLAVAWHPDGTRLASGGYDGKVRIWDPDVGEIVAVLDLDGIVSDLAWSPDGKDLVGILRDGRCVVLSVGPASVSERER